MVKDKLNYRTAGTLTPDPNCLLDVLAAAAAANLSEQRFSFKIYNYGQELLPEITEAMAQECIDTARTFVDREKNDPNVISMGVLDFLRGCGQQSTLDVLIRKLATNVTRDEIIAWREPAAKKLVSLHLESYHISDVSAAYRWQGSKPIERYSHPGRNILAAYTIIKLPILTCFLLNHIQRPWKFTTARVWPSPITPISFSAWEATCVSHVNMDGVIWWRCGVKPHGKGKALSVPEEFIQDNVYNL